MFYIIVIIIAIAIIGYVFGKIKDGIETLSNAVGPVTLIITAILSIIAFFAFSWIGVLVVVAFGLGIAFIMKKSGQALAEHDRKNKETATINQQTMAMDIRHRNQLALQDELNKNCKWLGEMNAEKWKVKLPNYLDKDYETSFESITSNFAKQIEEENILQNDEWFEVYLANIVKNNKGYSVAQLLNTVNCPQMQMTHITSTESMLRARLEQCTKKVSDDVPALLKKEAGDNYWPTKYALKKYGILETSTQNTTVYELDSL